MYSFLLYIPFKGKERSEQTNLFPAKLRRVLVTYGSSENFIVDSTQCYNSLRGEKIRAVLDCSESNSAKC